MKHRLYALLLIIFLTTTFVGCKLSDEDNEVLQNNDILNESIKSIDESVVSLQDIASFDWDNFYVFSPYASEESIEDAIGFSTSSIKSTVDETMQQLIFIKDNQIVCNIYGYSDNLGYKFSFKISDDYLMFSYSDNVSFTVDDENDYIVLSHIQ